MKRKLLCAIVALLTVVLVLGMPSITVYADKEGETTEETTENTDDETTEYTSDSTEELIEFEEEMICSGVFVDDLEIGGKSVSQARKIVTDYLEEILSKKITVKANDKEESVTVKDLGGTFTEGDYVDQALNIGKFGNVVRRYKDLKDVANDKKVYKVEIGFDEKKLNEFITKKAVKCNIEAKEPGMEAMGRLPESGASSSFSYKEGVTGKIIDVKILTQEINNRVKDWNKEDIVIEAAVKEEKPKHSVDELKQCNDRLGHFTTNYSSSGWQRCQNISTATGKIDGAVVYPGEEFSILNLIAPFTKSNGYAEAGSYSQGKVVDSLGGGVCQVSTTLYNAVLRAELAITMRNNHSMVVSYVPKSADAMIASSASRDFKFKNDTDTPIYVEAYTSGKNVTFNIYGKETRPSNRTISFESKVLKTIQPGKDVITEDKTKPTSYREVTQSAHVGYRAEYYKIVRVNGKETQRIKVNSSSYQAAPKYITVGTKEEPTEAPADETGVQDETVPEGVTPGRPNTRPNTNFNTKPGASAGTKPSASTPARPNAGATSQVPTTGGFN